MYGYACDLITALIVLLWFPNTAPTIRDRKFESLCTYTLSYVHILNYYSIYIIADESMSNAGLLCFLDFTPLSLLLPSTNSYSKIWTKKRVRGENCCFQIERSEIELQPKSILNCIRCLNIGSESILALLQEIHEYQL